MKQRLYTNVEKWTRRLYIRVILAFGVWEEVMTCGERFDDN